MRSITFYTRPQCHLCEGAKREFTAAFPEITIEAINVDSDPALARRYGMDIPVAVFENQELFRHRFDLESCRAVFPRGE